MTAGHSSCRRSPTRTRPGVPFGVYADVVTPGRVRVGDSLQPP